MKILLPLAFAFFLVSCSTPDNERQIQDQAARETAVSDGTTLGATIQDLIRDSKTLSASQKKELEGIIAVNKSTADALSEKSFKFRSVLIKELLSGKVDSKRLELIKKNIKEVEEAKLQNTFDTVDKISNITSPGSRSKKYVERLRAKLETPVE